MYYTRHALQTASHLCHSEYNFFHIISVVMIILSHKLAYFYQEAFKGNLKTKASQKKIGVNVIPFLWPLSLILSCVLVSIHTCD